MMLRRKIASRWLTINYNFVTNVDEIIEDKDIAIVVELIMYQEPLRPFTRVRWKQQCYVVSANKDLLAVHGSELLEIAQNNNLGGPLL